MREGKLRPEACKHLKFTCPEPLKLRQGCRKPASMETLYLILI